MLKETLNNYRIILASASPRRKQLLQELGLDFEVMAMDVDESFPPEMEGEEIAVYLSELKAKAFEFDDDCQKCLLIAADTIVWLDGESLPKPRDEAHAFQILQKLSGKSHEVITGVTLLTKDKVHSFSSTTKVFFKKLDKEEIDFYIKQYKPFDKAGAYGIQEWIGFVGIEKIEGSYFNVVGLPVQKLYTELILFLQ